MLTEKITFKEAESGNSTEAFKRLMMKAEIDIYNNLFHKTKNRYQSSIIEKGILPGYNKSGYGDGEPLKHAFAVTFIEEVITSLDLNQTVFVISGDLIEDVPSLWNTGWKYGICEDTMKFNPKKDNYKKFREIFDKNVRVAQMIELKELIEELSEDPGWDGRYYLTGNIAMEVFFDNIPQEYIVGYVTKDKNILIYHKL